jgi:hypothetical protein
MELVLNRVLIMLGQVGYYFQKYELWITTHKTSEFVQAIYDNKKKTNNWKDKM